MQGNTLEKGRRKSNGSVARSALLCAGLICSHCSSWAQDPNSQEPAGLERIRVSPDGKSFIRGAANTAWRGWGANYDHDDTGRLIEDYWATEWHKVEEDFEEMKQLGLNVVRIHLQLAKVMDSADQPNTANLDRLSRLIDLAAKHSMVLDLTGLGCYHKADVPAWYDKLGEADRWEVQARFWRAVAERARDRSAVFCYDLMNEPILPGEKPEKEWLAGEFGGKHFVQRITLDLAGRSRDDVAAAWIRKLVAAIREVDKETLITVGEIPWATVWPGAKSQFHSDAVGRELDFVSVHFYPQAGKLEQALDALGQYEIGKPLVVEECFPLACSLSELEQFMDRTDDRVDAWISFYWGATATENRAKQTIAGSVTAEWIEVMQRRATQAPQR